jgi:putative DNA-invertase from lambdoid prophage Rac
VSNPKKQIRNIYGYCRVSTTEQAENGISIDTQQELISEFVRDKFNRDVTEWFVDAGVSGTVPIMEREQCRAMTDVIDEYDIVIATRIDKEMAAKGLDSKYDMNSLVNQIMLMVLSAVAEMEFENTKKKFAEGKIAWAQRGYSIGGSAPFGFEFEEERLPQGNRMKTRKKLVEIPEEQAVIKTIQKCKQRGLGARRIAKQVANTHAGYEDFSPNKVVKILNRKFQGVAS